MCMLFHLHLDQVTNFISTAPTLTYGKQPDKSYLINNDKQNVS